MITRKHLADIGFKYINNTTAVLDLTDCQAVIIGGILSFTARNKNIYPIESMGYWRLKSIIEEMYAKCKWQAPAPVMTINEDGSWRMDIHARVSIPVPWESFYSIYPSARPNQ